MGGSVLYFCTWNCGQWIPVLCWPFCSFSLFVFATWGHWWWWFLVPAVDLLSATVDWTCNSCFACCCVRCASQCTESNVHHSVPSHLTKVIWWTIKPGLTSESVRSESLQYIFVAMRDNGVYNIYLNDVF